MLRMKAVVAIPGGMLAAVMGVTIPLVMQKLGRDPALGSSVMITPITNSGGFFIFLGLATLFLV